MGKAAGQKDSERVLSHEKPLFVTPYTLLNRVLEQSKLTHVAEKIVAQETLSLRDAEQLAGNASLPLLVNLVALDSVTRNRSLNAVRLRPLFHVPIGQLLEERGYSACGDHIDARLRDLSCDATSPNEPIFVAIDRWSGRFSFSELSQALMRICEFSSDVISFRILGPSTVDLVQMLESNDAKGESDSAYLEQVLMMLRELGVSAIEGGSDLDLHREAAMLGFETVFSHELALDSASRQELFLSADPNASDSRLTEFTREFLQEFLLVRSEIEPLGHFSTWFPWTASLLDHRSGKAVPIAVQVLRAIALGRLMFPETPYIRAPLSALGLKVAHVALEFGANDLGFAAVDSDTERALGVARLSDAMTIIQGHQVDSRFVV